MRNIIHLVVVINFFILVSITIVGESRFVPRPDKVHLGSLTNPRRWGRWCYQDNECGLGYCSGYQCQCYPGYITWHLMEACAYDQRSKLTAFLVSFFVGTLGVDWFYLSRGNPGYVIAGIIKLLISSACFIGWPFIFIGSEKKSRQFIVTGNVVNIIFTIASALWWLTDWIRVLADVFYDGNGVTLQPWGRDYYFYNRIPYRF